MFQIQGEPMVFYTGNQATPPFKHCATTGYPLGLPDWLAVWLLMIVDNTLHLVINYASIRWL